MKQGDYVIATKYSDGDPLDSFAVGFLVGIGTNGRFIVVDGSGEKLSRNGFRRAKKITGYVGEKFLSMISQIETSGVSIWKWIKKIEDEAKNKNNHT